MTPEEASRLTQAQMTALVGDGHNMALTPGVSTGRTARYVHAHVAQVGYVTTLWARSVVNATHKLNFTESGTQRRGFDGHGKGKRDLPRGVLRVSIRDAACFATSTKSAIRLLCNQSETSEVPFKYGSEEDGMISIRYAQDVDTASSRVSANREQEISDPSIVKEVKADFKAKLEEVQHREAAVAANVANLAKANEALQSNFTRMFEQLVLSSEATNARVQSLAESSERTSSALELLTQTLNNNISIGRNAQERGLENKTSSPAGKAHKKPKPGAAEVVMLDARS